MRCAVSNAEPTAAQVSSAHLKGEAWAAAADAATEALNMDASSVDAVIALANAHLGAEKYNDAIRTLRGAIDGSPDNVDDRLRQALQRAEAAR